VNHFISRVKDKALVVGSAVSTVALTAGSAFAQTSTPVDTVFDAIDLSSFAVKVAAVMVIGIGLSLAYAAYRHGKRVIGMS